MRVDPNATTRSGRRRSGVAVGVACSLGVALLVAPPSSAAAADGDPGTEMVSVATGGAPAAGTSHGVDLSGDGSIVAFGSNAPNLVTSGPTAFSVYVRDRNAGTTELVSVSDAGVAGNSTSLRPSISADGNRVAFYSLASNLVADDVSGTADVFAHDRVSGDTTLISASLAGSPANGRSQNAEISADGQYVVFESVATNLTADVVSGTENHVYRRHIDSGEIRLISQSSAGVPAARGGDSASVSGDGRYVAFRTYSYDLESPTSPFANIYVRDTVDGRTRQLAGSSSDQARDPSFSSDGRFVAYRHQSNAMRVVNRSSGASWRIGVGEIASLRLSHDGRHLVYYTGSSGGGRVYIWDRLTEQRADAMLADDGTPIPIGANNSTIFGPPGVSDDGRIVGFWTADPFDPADTDAYEDVFVRDRGDLLGPQMSSVVSDPASPAGSRPFTLTATADDSATGGAVVAAAEYSVDGRDWQAMTAEDGSFDSPTESVEATVPALGTQGGHDVCVRATDGRGNVGAQECINVVVESTTTPLAITVESVTQADGAAFPAALRPYAKLWIVPADGSLPDAGDYDYDTRQDPVAERHVDRGGDLFGTHGENVTTGSGTAIVHIEAGLETRLPDGTVVSQTPMDLSPAGGDSTASLVFTVDLETGLWSDHDGPVDAPVSCVASPATPDTDTFAGRLCFAVSTMSLTGDLDEDGLLDHWETMGLNTDTDPVIEVDLPTMGATPDHKDLFVQYDVEDDAIFTSNTEEGLKSVIDAFARAPIDAGGTVPNPDGQPGVRLWIDSPSSDPDLTLGGGQFLDTGRICELADAGFYDAKRRSFDYDRKWVFRYSLLESDDDEDAQGKGGCATGGQAEIAGNDFVVFNNDSSGATFMHELGHTLNLRHGGFENTNNKPNYVSLMNYAYTFDLRREDDGDEFLDFSPVRNINGTRPARLLPDVSEVSPPQGTILGPDRNHEIVYVSVDCSFTRANVSDPFDVAPNYPGPDSSPMYSFLNLPNDAFTSSTGKPVRPVECSFPEFAPQTHRDHNDWAAIDLKFRHSGDSQDGPINPSDDEDFPTDEEIALREIVSTTTDLAVEISTPAAPTPVGVTAEVIVTVSNRGTIPAGEPSVELVVAPGLAVTSVPGYCDAATLVCRPPLLASGASVDIPVQVRATAVGDQSVDAAVANTTGPEANAADNTASAIVTTIAAPPGPDPTASATPSPSGSATASPTPSASSTITPSPSVSATASPSPSASSTVTPTPSVSPTPSPTPSVSPTPSPAPSASTGPPAAVTTKKVVKTYFRVYSKKLTKAQKRKLRRALAAIPEDAEVAVRARGMVRAEGAKKADRKRATKRAKAVRAYLKTRGVPGSDITVSNKGRTRSRSAKARRVNVRFTYTTSAAG